MLRLNNSTSFTLSLSLITRLDSVPATTRAMRWSLRPPTCSPDPAPGWWWWWCPAHWDCHQLAKLERALSPLSVMDTQHHILNTDRENVHQPIQTKTLLQCLLFYSILNPLVKTLSYTYLLISPPDSYEVWFGSPVSVGDLHSWRRAAAPPAVSGWGRVGA